MSTNHKHPRTHHAASHPSGVFNKKNKWLLYIGIVLMLVGMAVYMGTLDESEVPEQEGAASVQTTEE